MRRRDHNFERPDMLKDPTHDSTWSNHSQRKMSNIASTSKPMIVIVDPSLSSASASIYMLFKSFLTKRVHQFLLHCSKYHAQTLLIQIRHSIQPGAPTNRVIFKKNLQLRLILSYTSSLLLQFLYSLVITATLPRVLLNVFVNTLTTCIKTLIATKSISPTLRKSRQISTRGQKQRLS